jgi:hypothetical protein
MEIGIIGITIYSQKEPIVTLNGLKLLAFGGWDLPLGHPLF